MAEHKILITGAMGAGKTTAIAAVSEIPPISTDVVNTDQEVRKATTTVGLDYGEITLSNGEKLRLYGTPGQERFSFMWPILAKGALGVIILVDNSRPQALADFAIYVEGFRDLIGSGAGVVAVGRTETHASPSIDAYAELLADKNLVCPVIPVDVRQREQVIFVLDLLFAQIESRMS